MRSHCSVLALPYRFSLIALAIRICSRRTCDLTVCQLIAFHFIEYAEDAPIKGMADVVICFSSYWRFSRFSCHERPVRRGLTFVPGNVSTRIRALTARHSLFRTSQTRMAMGIPCGLLSLLQGSHTGFSRSATEVCWVRFLLSTGQYIDCEAV